MNKIHSLGCAAGSVLNPAVLQEIIRYYLLFLSKMMIMLVDVDYKWVEQKLSNK